MKIKNCELWLIQNKGPHFPSLHLEYNIEMYLKKILDKVRTNTVGMKISHDDRWLLFVPNLDNHNYKSSKRFQHLWNPLPHQSCGKFDFLWHYFPQDGDSLGDWDGGGETWVICSRGKSKDGRWRLENVNTFFPFLDPLSLYWPSNGCCTSPPLLLHLPAPLCWQWTQLFIPIKQNLLVWILPLPLSLVICPRGKKCQDQPQELLPNQASQGMTPISEPDYLGWRCPWSIQLHTWDQIFGKTITYPPTPDTTPKQRAPMMAASTLVPWSRSTFSQRAVHRSWSDTTPFMKPCGETVKVNCCYRQAGATKNVWHYMYQKLQINFYDQSNCHSNGKDETYSIHLYWCVHGATYLIGFFKFGQVRWFLAIGWELF